MSIIDVARKFLADQEYIEPGDEIEVTESLLERGIIDSVGIMKLVVLLEETYKIQIDDDDLMPENFDSLEAIESYVEGKVA